MTGPARPITLIGTCLGLALTGAPWAQAQDAQSYRAQLAPLNASAAGSETSGEAMFTITGDDLAIHVTVNGAPPGIEHLQHFHGFASGDGDATCPTPASDTNGDGVIDLGETEPGAGTTMVPFHDDPVSLEIVKDTYPKAGADGSYSYDQTVSLKALQDAFGEQFNGQGLDLERRVIFIHGVPESAPLPGTAASLDDIPAHVTLPIACGKIMADG